MERRRGGGVGGCYSKRAETETISTAVWYLMRKHLFSCFCHPLNVDLCFAVCHPLFYFKCKCHYGISFLSYDLNHDWTMKSLTCLFFHILVVTASVFSNCSYNFLWPRSWKCQSSDYNLRLTWKRNATRLHSHIGRWFRINIKTPKGFFKRNKTIKEVIFQTRARRWRLGSVAKVVP